MRQLCTKQLDGQFHLDSRLVGFAELLKRTAEKKEERYKERLNDYYRRNYGDYFAFEAGPGSSRTNGLSPETRQKMLDFLEKK